MDIGSKHGYPAAALSNFSPHPFTFDGVLCNSMEGFLQALKFDKAHIQVEVCKLIGLAAKKRGRQRNKRWQTLQMLWWNWKAYKRDSQEYQDLLWRAYGEMLKQSPGFRTALIFSFNSVFTHSIGHNDSSKTVLTATEFCSILTKLRRTLQ